MIWNLMHTSEQAGTFALRKTGIPGSVLSLKPMLWLSMIEGNLWQAWIGMCMICWKCDSSSLVAELSSMAVSSKSLHMTKSIIPWEMLVVMISDHSYTAIAIEDRWEGNTLVLHGWHWTVPWGWLCRDYWP